MGYQDDPVWQGLAIMRIEPDGAALTFARRLARDNGWSRRFAGDVVTEYHRFLYLAATGSAPVTPSDQVDQAWHLHLAYTQHYWGVLCGQIIGRPLHHGPTAGGGTEGRKYRAMYAATLARYRDVFGCEPPSAIWPEPSARFAARYQWVDRKQHIVVPRRPFNVAGMAVGAFMVAACTAVAAEKAVQHTPGTFETVFNYALAGFFVLMIGVIVLVFIAAFRRSRHRKRTGRGGTGDTGGSDYSADSWNAGGGSAAGGAAFMAGGGNFGGAGSDGGWDSGAGEPGGGSGGESDGGSGGCSGGCGGGD